MRRRSERDKERLLRENEHFWQQNVSMQNATLTQSFLCLLNQCNCFSLNDFDLCARICFCDISINMCAFKKCYSEISAKTDYYERVCAPGVCVNKRKRIFQTEAHSTHAGVSAV